MAAKPIVITSHFKLVFLTVVVLTVISGAVSIYIMCSNSSRLTMAEIPEIQKRVFELAVFGWQSGFGAILGLIGGKLLG